MIKKKGPGKRAVTELGEHKTKKEAEEQIRAIEASKHRKRGRKK